MTPINDAGTLRVFNIIIIQKRSKITRVFTISAKYYADLYNKGWGQTNLLFLLYTFLPVILTF